ncbi:MAG: DUF2125 domain-containing protein [Alphaproteobacteria bacterium]
MARGLSRHWAPRRETTVLLVLLVALLAYTGYWFDVAHRVRGDIAQWADERRVEGYEVAYGEPKTSGFPFRLAVELARPSIGRTTPDAAWAWRGDRLSIMVRPWRLRRAWADLPTRQSLVLERDGRSWHFDAWMQSAVVAIVLNEAGGADVAGEVSRLSLRSPVAGLPFRVAVLRLSGRQRNDGQGQNMRITLELENLTLPAGLETPLGDAVKLFAVDATLRGEVPDGPLADALAAWRDSGGTVEVQRLKTRWGPLGLEVDGTLALDEAMRPLASMTAAIEGYGETLDALVKAGALARQQGALAKTALDLLAKPQVPGGPPVLTVPVTAQDGDLYVGPVRLLELSAVLPPKPAD